MLKLSMSSHHTSVIPSYGGASPRDFTRASLISGSIVWLWMYFLAWSASAKRLTRGPCCSSQYLRKTSRDSSARLRSTINKFDHGQSPGLCLEMRSDKSEPLVKPFSETPQFHPASAELRKPGLPSPLLLDFFHLIPRDFASNQ